MTMKKIAVINQGLTSAEIMFGRRLVEVREAHQK